LQSTGTTILPYLSQGFRYLVSNAAVPITDFEQPDFDDSAFLVGDAPFGYTPTMPPGNTVWPLSQDLNIRKEFWVPAGVTTLEVALAIDDYAQVFVNGIDVSNGLQPGLSVAEYDDLVFDIPMHLINPGAANLLAIWAVDHGVVAYFDVEIRATVVDPTGALIIPEPFGVLANDLDVDGGELSALLVQDVENGTLELRDDGSFTYTPDTRFVGVDRFTYVASDGVDSSNPATVTINPDSLT